MDRPEDADFHAALASPVRRRVLDVLQAADDPPTAQELATRLGLHVTTVRFHLDQLEQAGLVARQTEHTNRRGRPALRFRAVGLEAGRAREQMIEALAHALAHEGPAGQEQPAAAGRRWADRLAVTSGDPADAITEVFGRLGFDPGPAEPGPAGAAIELRSCPFRAAARRHPQVVCQVHLGLAQRLAQRAADGAQVRVGLVPFVEPELCLITLTRDPART